MIKNLLRRFFISCVDYLNAAGSFLAADELLRPPALVDGGIYLSCAKKKQELASDTSKKTSCAYLGTFLIQYPM
ncbi:MAG TPA: hypothetical protein DET40_16155 [Lentisphaeria bacterium]|nr:MAG: hypothetical protein A2X45_22510 [Lentisphaerae bacterium GWF2_50_93]HCE45074.1 hypothetical protein [Lentisphaeria bacterium]